MSFFICAQRCLWFRIAYYANSTAAISFITFLGFEKSDVFLWWWTSMLWQFAKKRYRVCNRNHVNVQQPIIQTNICHTTWDESCPEKCTLQTLWKLALKNKHIVTMNNMLFNVFCWIARKLWSFLYTIKVQLWASLK